MLQTKDDVATMQYALVDAKLLQNVSKSWNDHLLQMVATSSMIHSIRKNARGPRRLYKSRMGANVIWYPVAIGMPSWWNRSSTMDEWQEARIQSTTILPLLVYGLKSPWDVTWDIVYKFIAFFQTFLLHHVLMEGIDDQTLIMILSTREEGVIHEIADRLCTRGFCNLKWSDDTSTRTVNSHWPHAPVLMNPHDGGKNVTLVFANTWKRRQTGWCKHLF